MSKPYVNNRRSALVLEARAGLIPASDDIEDELDARVARIGRALRTYTERAPGPDDLTITDILHDLRHYCDSRALEFDRLDTAAYTDYLEYVDESPWISRSEMS